MRVNTLHATLHSFAHFDLGCRQMIRKTDIPVEAQHEDTYQWLNYSVSLLVSAATEAEQYGAILW